MSDDRMDQNTVARAMIDKIDLARSGDPVAAVAAAMLIHRYPEVSRELSLGSDYDALLSQAFLSKDPEFLVCVADEISKGKYLASNGKLAGQFLERADHLSPFMGAYALGRLLTNRNNRLAIKFFLKAQQAGHIPSAIRRHRLLCKQLPVIGIIIRVFYLIIEGIMIKNALSAREHLYERFWRYRDFSEKPLLEKDIGEDRAKPFADVFKFDVDIRNAIGKENRHQANSALAKHA